MAGKLTLGLKGLSCKHCVSTLQEGLGEISGIEQVTVDLKNNQAVLDVTEVSEELKTQLSEKISELGYEVTSFS